MSASASLLGPSMTVQGECIYTLIPRCQGFAFDAFSGTRLSVLILRDFLAAPTYDAVRLLQVSIHLQEERHLIIAIAVRE